MLIESDFHLNDQFAHLPDSDKGYRATVIKYLGVHLTGNVNRVFEREFYIPPVMIKWSFLEKDTANHSVRATVDVEEVKNVLEGEFPGIFNKSTRDDIIEFEIFVDFKGKIVGEKSMWDKS